MSIIAPIRDIFIPQTINSYYLVAQRIVAFDICLYEIRVTICYATGNNRIIEKCIEESIKQDMHISYSERLINALISLKPQLGKYTTIVLALDSSVVVFKELTVPFLQEKKIKQIVPYEVESLLPFTLDQAIIDSIITKYNTSNKHSDILVAAVKKEYITNFIDIFNASGLIIDKITVDMFEFYTLFKILPAYKNLQDMIVLIDLGLSTTRLAIAWQGQLKYIRTLPKGIITIAKKLTEDNNLTIEESLHRLMHFSSNEQDTSQYSLDCKELLSELFNEIQFTINAYGSKLKLNTELKHIFFTGNGADIPGINLLIKQNLGIDSTLFSTKQITHDTFITSKVKHISNKFMISIASALALPSTQEFNLQHRTASQKEDQLLNKQLIVVFAIILALFGSITLYSYLRLRSLRIIKDNAQNEAIAQLKQIFKLRAAQSTTLETANKNALKELKKQQSTWLQLEPENRYALLKYLVQLSKCITTQDTQLNLTSIVIKDNSIKLYGQVPDYPQLNKLQKQLNNCPLFKNLSKLEDPNFKSEPITLTINKEQES